LLALIGQRAFGESARIGVQLGKLLLDLTPK
jgi:hypothetical protein